MWIIFLLFFNFGWTVGISHPTKLYEKKMTSKFISNETSTALSLVVLSFSKCNFDLINSRVQAHCGTFCSLDENCLSFQYEDGVCSMGGAQANDGNELYYAMKPWCKAQLLMIVMKI